jgi:hypothetical protein
VTTGLDKFQDDWEKQDATAMLNLLKGVSALGGAVAAAADAVRGSRNASAHACKFAVSATTLADAVGHAGALLVALEVDEAEWRGLLDARRMQQRL